MRVTVVGIGHSLRGDDSAGMEAVRAWERDCPASANDPRVQVEFVESPGIELIAAFDGAEAVLLVDAVCSGDSTGKLHRLQEGDIMDLGGRSGSMHGWGVPEALRLAKALGIGNGGRNIRLLGIEAAQMDIGESLSPAVRKSIPAAVAAIDDEIKAFLAA